MAINRTPFNALVDDDGSGTTGTIWNKAQIQGVILDPVDAAILAPTSPIVLASGQIQFPTTASPSANAYTLDDYREGTFTPILTGSGGGTGITYSAQQGAYVKVGRLVYVMVYVNLSAKGTISGTVNLAGLPFAVASPFFSWVPLRWISLATAWVQVAAIPTAGGTDMTLWGMAAAGGTSNAAQLAATDLGNSSGFVGAFGYHAAS